MMVRLLVFGVFISSCLFGQIDILPFIVDTTLFNYSQPNTLGLSKPAGVTAATIYSASANIDKYCNGAVTISFKNELFVQWQSSTIDEDAPDTWVAYSKSSNFLDWTKPDTLSLSHPNGYCTSGGWWTDGNTLVAFINVWNDTIQPRGGYVEYKLSSDGINWSKAERVLDINGSPLNGIIEQDPHQLPVGRIITAFHIQPGLIATPFFTNDPLAISGWKTGKFNNLSIKNNVSRELEPSLFYNCKNEYIMIFRDQSSTYKKLASVSTNDGETWTKPVLTNMPDSRSKQSAGNLPDGTAFMVSNPTNDKTRFPLVITLASDGFNFNKAYLLRAGGKELPGQNFKGKYKRIGYHYPKSFVDSNFLYVSYTTNKELVEITRIPIGSLK